jgi:hypothetical protein
VLTAVTTGITDADGLGAFTYQWLRNGVTIGGATATTYTLSDLDVGTQISLQVDYTDGQGTAESLTSAQTAAVANVNDAPVLQRNQALQVNEGGSALLDAAHLLSTDLEASADQLSYQITNAPTSGQLLSTTTPERVRTQFTQAEIDAGQLQYVHDGSETVTDTFTFTVTDPQGATIGSVSFQITITPQNDAPVLQTSSPPGLLYKGGLQTLDPAINISDSDSATITQASIHISSNYIKGEDRLILSGTHPLSTQWNEQEGTLTLSGEASLSTYATALSSVQFSSTDTANQFREMMYSVSDGQLASTPLNKNLEVGYVPEAKIVAPVFTSVNNSVAPLNTLTTENKTETPAAGNINPSTINPSNSTQPIVREGLEASNLLEEQSGSDQSASSLLENKALGEAGISNVGKSGNVGQQQASVLFQRRGEGDAQAITGSNVGTQFGVDTLRARFSLEEVLLYLVGSKKYDADFLGSLTLWDATKLNLTDTNSSGYQVADITGNTSNSYLNALDYSRGFLDEKGHLADANEKSFNFDILVQPSVAGGLLLSSLILWWATRAGGLLAAMMVSVPAWRSFDPLPILAHSQPDGLQDKFDLKSKKAADDALDHSRFGGELGPVLQAVNSDNIARRSGLEELSR